MNCWVFGSRPSVEVYATYFSSGENENQTALTCFAIRETLWLRKSRIARSPHSPSVKSAASGLVACSFAASVFLLRALKTITDGSLRAGFGKRSLPSVAGRSALAWATLIPSGRILHKMRWLSEDHRTISKPKNDRTITPGKRSDLPVAFSHIQIPASGKSERFTGVIVRSFFGFEIVRWTYDSHRILCKILPEG